MAKKLTTDVLLEIINRGEIRPYKLRDPARFETELIIWAVAAYKLCPTPFVIKGELFDFPKNQVLCILGDRSFPNIDNFLWMEEQSNFAELCTGINWN